MIPSPGDTSRPRHAAVLFAASASVLAHEILLMRILSFAYWHHLASMAVSMALLGFGAAGSFLFLARERVWRDPDAALAALAAAAALSLPGSLILFRALDLDPFLLVWQPGEWGTLVGAYLSLSLPFFFAGGMAAVVLGGAGERTPRMYAADLSGAAVGALTVVPALFLGPPWTLAPALGGVLLLAALPCARASGRPRRASACLVLAAAGLVLVSLTRTLAPQIHETKGLPMALAVPDARVEATRCGPLGFIHVVRSRAFHDIPGLSLQYAGASSAGLPEQMGLFTDGSGPESITRWTGDPEETLPLDYTARALAFHIRPVRSALVVGAGGGVDALLCLHHGVKRVHALEANPQVADLLTGPLARFSGRLFEQPGVRLIRDEARRFLRRPGPSYDLVLVPPAGGPGGAAGGVHAAGEDYLRTVEATKSMLGRLSDQGMVSITCWSQVPPRGSLRTLATALKALRRSGAKRPERSVLVIRSWNAATILASRRPFSSLERARMHAFCEERSFDPVYAFGMGPDPANRFDRLARPWYYEGARALCGPEADAFLRDYLYDVSPATDDRPYGSKFFRWDRAPELFAHLGREWLPRVESGYVFLAATLIQAVLAAAAFILLPLCFRRGRSAARRETIRPGTASLPLTLLYFACPGFGFMFFEMVLLPRFTLLLAHPVYAAAVVLCVMLLFAGLGSRSLQRLREDREGRVLWAGAALLGLWLAVAVLAGDGLVDRALAWDGPLRLGVSAACLAIPAFLLGWPFPLGLRAVSRNRPALVPWAWAVNGCASVVGAVLAKTLAMSLGFRAVLAAGWGLYVMAAWLFPAAGRTLDIKSGS